MTMVALPISAGAASDALQAAMALCSPWKRYIRRIHMQDSDSHLAANNLLKRADHLSNAEYTSDKNTRSDWSARRRAQMESCIKFHRDVEGGRHVTTENACGLGVHYGTFGSAKTGRRVADMFNALESTWAGQHFALGSIGQWFQVKAERGIGQ